MDAPVDPVHPDLHRPAGQGGERQVPAQPMLQQVPTEGITLVVASCAQDEHPMTSSITAVGQVQRNRLVHQHAQGMLGESPGVVPIDPQSHLHGRQQISVAWKEFHGRPTLPVPSAFMVVPGIFPPARIALVGRHQFGVPQVGVPGHVDPGVGVGQGLPRQGQGHHRKPIARLQERPCHDRPASPVAVATTQPDHRGRMTEGDRMPPLRGSGYHGISFTGMPIRRGPPSGMYHGRSRAGQ